MLTLINPSIVPNPGYFMVKHPTTGHVVTSPNIRLIFTAYQSYCRANDLPFESNAEIVRHMCEQNPDLCIDRDQPSLVQKIVAVFKDGTKWIMNGMPITKGEALEYRLKTCQACEHFSGINESLFRVSCSKCGCTGLKINMATTKCPINRWSECTT